MPPEDSPEGFQPGVEPPVETDVINDFLSDATPAAPEPSGEGSLTPAAGEPQPEPPGIEEFDIDGRKIGKDALFQTYRQFAHLQQRHQQAKPILDFIQEIGITPELVPQFRAWIAKQLSAGPSGTPAPETAPIEQQPWFQEMAETFPAFATFVKEQLDEGQIYRQELTNLKQGLAGYTQALETQRQQEAALTVVQTAADAVSSMMTEFPRLQDPAVRGAFLRWVWEDKQAGPRIADPEYLRGMYMVFDQQALAEQWQAQAIASQHAHAATVARGFAETGAPRGAMQGSKSQQELEDFLID